jgi:arabinan endo-1,5-alpha-L-arabinosidase
MRHGADRRPSPPPGGALRVLLGMSLALLLVISPTGARTALPQSAGTYSNPVIPQNVADPSIIKALDGYYYLSGSSDFWNDGSYHILPIFRSTDLVTWSFVSDAFPARPNWAADDAGIWAPDLRYFNGKYYLYYMSSWTKPLPAYATDGGSAIGVATADTPSGPWTDTGPSAGPGYLHGPLIPPRSCASNTDPGCYYWTFDPAEFTDQNGQRYLYYGSYFGGTLTQPLADNGLQTAGAAVQIGHWDRYEGTYVIRHDVNGQRYYVNFSSASDCCRGPNTAYSVETNRATSPTGTFIDQNGYPMLYPGSTPAPTSRPVDDPAGDNFGHQGGGYPTLKQNGNKWHGTGHNAVITDLAGHQWIVYHGVDVSHPWLTNGPNFPITFRQVLLDRLDWTAEGWPVVNSGSGPSDGARPVPVTVPLFGDNFNVAPSCGVPETNGSFSTTWRMVAGTWTEAPGTCQTGGYAESTGSTDAGLVVSNQSVPAGARVECDLKMVSGAGGYGCVTAYQQNGNSNHSGRGFVAYIDVGRHVLVTGIQQNDRQIVQQQSTPLPTNFNPTEWHHLAIDEVLGQQGRPTFNVTLSDRNRDPLAVLDQVVPAEFANHDGSVGFFTAGTRADFDNISSAMFNDGTAPAQGTPTVGAPLSAYSDEFDNTLGPQWSWIREDPTMHSFVQGQLQINVNGDLYRDSNDATNLLLENQPAGSYMVETKLTFDPNDNYQQAGLLVYSDDDHYMKVGPVHSNSLNKMISGKESLEVAPPSQPGCDIAAPAPGSNVAVTPYTHEQCPNEGEAWDYLTNAAPTVNGVTAASPQVTDWLRIYRTGNIYTPYTSVDGQTWVKGAAWEITAASPAFPVKIGLFAFAGGSKQHIPARFDYVHVYSEP